MNIPTLFKEYIWLVETIYHAERITFAELSQKWSSREESGGSPFSRTTFNRHRDAIQDMFGVIIECDRKDGYRYYIYNKEVLSNNSVANWLFSTLSVGNILDENVGLQRRILLESIPSGGIHLRRIIKAMRQGRKMLLTYQKYSSATNKTYLAAPYCVKLFKRRWYVLTKVDRPVKDGEPGQVESSMSVFSLDRIVNIQLHQDKFTLDAGFDADAYFAQSFGIMVDNKVNPEKVVLRAYGMEKYYLRDLPIHPSQREVSATDEYADFELFLRPTSDFKAHLLSRGEWLQVIQPQWLASDIQNWLQAAIQKYKKE
jgi:hypothetical protein